MSSALQKLGQLFHHQQAAQPVAHIPNALTKLQPQGIPAQPEQVPLQMYGGQMQGGGTNYAQPQQGTPFQLPQDLQGGNVQSQPQSYQNSGWGAQPALGDNDAMTGSDYLQNPGIRINRPPVPFNLQSGLMQQHAPLPQYQQFAKYKQIPS